MNKIMHMVIYKGPILLNQNCFIFIAWMNDYLDIEPRMEIISNEGRTTTRPTPVIRETDIFLRINEISFRIKS